MHHAHTATAGTVALALGSLSLLAPLASAGLVGSGGSHDWVGNLSSNWHNAGNWTSGQVPGADAAAIVVGGAPSVYLSADSANLSSLFIGAGRAVSTNGHLLRVRMSAASTTVTGVDAELFISSHGDALALDTAYLGVSANAELRMAGGRARITNQLAFATGGTLGGYGSVEIDSASPAAFNALDGGPLSVFSGDLDIEVTGGGGIVLPDVVNVLQANRALSISGPLFLPAADVNLGPNCLFQVSGDWTLGGELEAVPGGTASATVVGDGWMSVSGQVNVASERTLGIDGRVHLLTGAVATVGEDSTLEINDTHRANPGSSLTVAAGGVVRFNGPQVALLPWASSMTLDAATLETNSPSGVWISNGPVQLGSFAGVRSRVAGSATTRILDSLVIDGHGAEVDGTLELALGADMDLVHLWTRLVVGGALRLGNSTTSGDGAIEIADGGVGRIAANATIGVDLINAGELHLGLAPGDVGYKYVTGSLTQQPTGRLLIDIAGPAPVERDVWETSGALSLDGALEIQLAGGFEPSVGDTFEILYTNGGLDGAFSAVEGEPGFSVSYGANVVTLTYVGVDETLFGDLNGDGVVDGADLGILLASWGACIECGDCIADLDGDCTVDGADLGLLLANWAM